MQFWEKKMNCNEKVNTFLAFSFNFHSKHGNERKKHWKILFPKEIYIFFIEMAFNTFYVTWKIDFLQNVVKTNKKV